MNSTRERRIAAVERYVHDLAIALADLPTDEREEVIAGIREHIDDALASDASDDPGAVEGVLASLGDPAEIAADARGRSRAPSLPPPPPPRTTTTDPPQTNAAPHSASDRVNAQPRRLLAHEWVPAGTMMLFVLAGALSWMFGFTGSPIAILMWLIGLALLLGSPLWRSTEKFVATLWFGVAPVAGVSLLGGGGVLYWATNGMFDPYYGSGSPLTLLSLAGLAVTIVLMVWLVSVGSKRVSDS